MSTCRPLNQAVDSSTDVSRETLNSKARDEVRMRTFSIHAVKFTHWIISTHTSITIRVRMHDTPTAYVTIKSRERLSIYVVAIVTIALTCR